MCFPGIHFPTNYFQKHIIPQSKVPELYKYSIKYEIPWSQLSVCVNDLLELCKVRNLIYFCNITQKFSPACCSVICLIQLFPRLLYFILFFYQFFNIYLLKYIPSVFILHGYLFKLVSSAFTYTIFPFTVYGTWFLTYSCAIKDAVLTNWLL